MSRQSSLDDYFNKSKMTTPRTSQSSLDKSGMDNCLKGKKRTLSLVRSSSKNPKTCDNIKEEVIYLSSDEDIASTPPNLHTEVDIIPSPIKSEPLTSDSSDNTIPYDLTPKGSVTTPQQPSQTPVKTSPVISQPHQTQSPQENKFYSPNKKRSVTKKPYMNVKRNLSKEMNKQSNAPTMNNAEVFTQACAGMDDKTIFLLTIINKYLNDTSLLHLLDFESQTLLANCLCVIKPGMRVVCRLYWRKKGWYKKDQICHIITRNGKETIEESHLEIIINSLIEFGLIVQGDDTNVTFEEFKSILNKEELMQICKELKLKVSSKQDALAELTKYSKSTSNISKYFYGVTSNNYQRVLKIMSDKSGSLYKLSDLTYTTLYNLHILMYLGMNYNIIRDKILELTLLYDKIQRETFPIDKNMILDNASIVFKTKDEFDSYLKAHNIYEDYLTKTEVTDKCNIVKDVYNHFNEIGQEEMLRYETVPSWLRRYTPAYIFVKILDEGIKDLKKGGHNMLALSILSTLLSLKSFRQHRRAEWYAEKALILHGLQKPEEAAEVFLEGLNSNISEEAKDNMRPRARKIASQKNILLSTELRQQLLEHANKDNILESNLRAEHIHKQPMDRIGKRGKVKFETRIPEGRMIQEAEEYCIGHYICSKDFTDGEHWEGQIVTTIFFLLFWDIIYSKPPDVAGVFLSYFQRYPLDLFTEDFYHNRKTAIDHWLGVIERATDEKIIKIMEDTWTIRPEYELSGISRGLGWEKIRAVAQCLGAGGMAALCRRLATNYRYTHSGFPDLTLWNAHTKQIKFVEVKTDTDKPSMKQIQWMHYLRENGIDTEFCYVGVNTTRQKCRTVVNKESPKISPVKTEKTNCSTPEKVTVKFETPVDVKHIIKVPKPMKEEAENSDDDFLSPPNNNT